MNKALHIVIGLVFLTTIGLAGCGKKGPLKRPADAQKEETRGPDGKQSHQSFVLDRLL